MILARPAPLASLDSPTFQLAVAHVNHGKLSWLIPKSCSMYEFPALYEPAGRPVRMELFPSSQRDVSQMSYSHEACCDSNQPFVTPWPVEPAPTIKHGNSCKGVNWRIIRIVRAIPIYDFTSFFICRVLCASRCLRGIALSFVRAICEV